MKGALRMQRHVCATTSILILMLIAAIAAPVFAHEGAKGIVKERMDVMKSIGAAMKTIGKTIRGDTPFVGQEIEKAAAGIARHGARISQLFPAGSHDRVSEASPRIWQDFAGFHASAEKMVATAREVEAAGRSNDLTAVKTGFRALGKTCGSCHKQYRIKKKRH